jgi:undecaprenyl-diphosphatase
MKNTRRQFIILITILAILSLALSIYAWRNTRFPGDLYLTLQLQSFHNETFRSIMEWLSYLFASWRAALIVIAAGLMVWWRIGRLEGLLFPAVGLFSLFAYALKIAINQPRPSAGLVQVLTTESSRGFPSSHAFFSVLVLGLMAYLLFVHLRTRWMKIFSLAVLIMLGLLVGTSRVYLGVHWTSEVIGGYLTGGVFLMLILWFYENRRSKQTDN